MVYADNTGFKGVAEKLLRNHKISKARGVFLG
jgi:hypothetical protein